ncbi:MAG: hypothetical protein ACKVT0_16210 [Planctomycetaceae bacterium]
MSAEVMTFLGIVPLTREPDDYVDSMRCASSPDTVLSSLIGWYRERDD